MISKVDVQNWINGHLGKYVDFDKAYGIQCWDLAAQYLGDLWGVSAATVNSAAKSVPDNTMVGVSGWSRGNWNSNEGVLKFGDLITYNQSPYDPTYGHIAIYIGNGQRIDTNGTGNGDPVTVRSLDAARGYTYLRPPITDNTTNNINKGEEEPLMFTFHINNDWGSFTPTRIYLWNIGANKIVGLDDPAELDAWRTLYKEMTGKDLVHKEYQTSAPWFARLMGGTNPTVEVSKY